MKTLITYKFEEYEEIKTSFNSEGKEIVSISAFQSEDIEDEISSFEKDVVVDISSLVNEEINSPLIFTIEKLINQFPDDLIFISNYSSESYKFRLRYCFDEIEEFQQDDNNKSYGDINKIINITQFKSSVFLNIIEDFNKSLIGHEKFKKEFETKLNEFRIFNSLDEHPVFSLFIMGESGVGKSEVARALYKVMGGKKNLSKINFGNYSSQDSLNSLIGSPRGYIGSENGELFDNISKTDVGLVLIDEFEKSTPAVFNYFLNLLESGSAINSLGQEYDLTGFIFIFTSNINNKDYDKVFSPELRSRFDYPVKFNHLTEDDKDFYVRKRTSEIISKYKKKYNNEINDFEVTQKVVSEIDVINVTNVRELNRLIREKFVEFLDIYKE